MAWSVESLAARVRTGRPADRDDALQLLEAARVNPWPVLAAADDLRRHFRGSRIHLCGIAAVKLGRCGEDCRWCAQSAHWHAGVEPRGLLPTGDLVRAAREAAGNRASSFGLVTSGSRLSDAERALVVEAARAIGRETGLEVCGSFGALDREAAAALREAGFRRYNHNLETSARHFPNVCTTHTYEDRLRTARAVREAGLALCSGGIFGVGEAGEDRVDVAVAVRDLGAAVVPLNFLDAIPGTPLGVAKPLAPLEILATVAMFRFVLPDRTIKLAGGRERNLRNLQALMFFAGADACLVGNYLTTTGRPAEEDLAMLRDLGLEPAADRADEARHA